MRPSYADDPVAWWHGDMVQALPQPDLQKTTADVALRGQCLCGAITVMLTGTPGALMYCHCRQCRKSAGAPFQAVLPIAASASLLDDLRQQLRSYRASPGKARYFCAACASPIYSQRDDADVVRVRAGILDLPSTLA